MDNKKQTLFEKNSKYFTISCYVLGVILIAILAFRVINSWEATRRLLTKAFSVIGPYFIGFLIAYLVNPLVNFFYAHLFRDMLKLKSRKMKGLLSVLLAYLIVLGLFIIIIGYIVPQLIASLTDLISQIPDFYNQILVWINHFVEKNPKLNTTIINSITNDYLPHLQTYVLQQLQNIIPALYGAGISIIKFFVNLFIAVIVSIYMVSDKKQIISYIKKVIYAFFSEKHSESMLCILKDCNAICKSFFIGKTIDSLIIGCLCFIIMSIIGLPYSMLISVIVAITNMIPYFGPYIGAIPGIIILFIEKPTHGFIFAIVIILLQFFDGTFLGPKILGTSTGLRPLVILFAISCGGAIAGPLGMFLGVPAFAILRYLLDKYINHRLKEKNIKSSLY